MALHPICPNHNLMLSRSNKNKSMLAADELPPYNYEDYRRWKGEWEPIEGIPYDSCFTT